VALLVLGVSWAAGCADDEEKGCRPFTATGCEGGLWCEEVEGGEPACFAPVELRGQVFDAATDAGVPGATVVALDANGAARSGVAVTRADGTFALRVPVRRRGPDGAPIAAQVVLRVAAQGYQWFAKPPRTALPVDLADATTDDGGGAALVVEGPETQVALIALPGGASGVRLAGRVTTDDDLGFGDDDDGVGGVLVVAEQGAGDAARAVSTAVSGEDGAFVLFNVPAGATTLRGFHAGIVVEPLAVEAGSDQGGLVLEAAAADLPTVSGKVEIVDAPGGARTSVILAVASTFDPLAASGEAPVGLRAAPVSGGFAIEDVPPGRYVVLAGFENDGLVRDPDQSIGGTDLVTIEVAEGSPAIALEESFKVTAALEIRSPGADGTGVVSDATPTFVWADDSSEDGYELRVYDVFGALVFEDTEVGRVTGSDTVSFTWDAAGAVPGLVYQLRVRSFRDKRGTREYIALSEDLRGVFRWLPAGE
jgi:hypothetical protein